MAEEKNIKTDIDRLVEAMNGFRDANFEPIDRSKFDNPEYADAFNEMLNTQVERNNRYLARINDAQMRIGDTSCLKSMFEQITAQEKAIKVLQEARLDITPDERPLTETNMEFLALSAQLKNTFRPCSEDIKEALELYDRLDVPSNETWSEMEENEEHLILRNLQKCIQRAAEKLASMERRIGTIDEDVRGLFEVIDKKSSMGTTFLKSVDSLSKSYEDLSGECLDTGRHLYRISRDIDRARNDMFRHNANPSLHDRLRVYEVDHVTLAWRLYNNIVEFESLKITQVNNPESCKLGLWINNMTDPLLAGTECFKRLVDAHNKLHEECIECFLAKQNYDTIAAMDRFANVMDALKVFQQAMDEIHDYLRSKGVTEETDVLQFREA